MQECRELVTGEPATPVTPSAAAPTPSFLMACGPEVMLSAEKDRFYSGQIAERIARLVEWAGGAWRAQLLAPELGLLADALYYGLTLGAGRTTLGQEYCDVVPLHQRGMMLLPIGTSRGSLAAALQALLPYLDARLIRGGGWRSGWAPLRDLVADPADRATRQRIEVCAQIS